MLSYYILAAIAFYVFYQVFFKSEAIGNWNHLFPNMNYDASEFYNSVESLIKSKQIPMLYTSKVILREGTFLSNGRLYLEIRRYDFKFHICAAPWGTDYFFSWWVRKNYDELDIVLLLIPFVGDWLVKKRQHQSYYKLDTEAMFRKSVHESVLEVIDQITTAKGIRLSDVERNPHTRRVITLK